VKAAHFIPFLVSDVPLAPAAPEPIDALHYFSVKDDGLRLNGIPVSRRVQRVGEAGVYVCRVVDRKISRGEVFLVTDGGLHHHLAASGNFGQVIRKNYPVVVANRVRGGERERSNVVGPLCTPLDLLGASVALSRADVRDLVAVMQSGAYGLSASPQGFLSHPKAGETPAMIDSWQGWRKRPPTTQKEWRRDKRMLRRTKAWSRHEPGPRATVPTLRPSDGSVTATTVARLRPQAKLCGGYQSSAAVSGPERRRRLTRGAPPAAALIPPTAVGLLHDHAHADPRPPDRTRERSASVRRLETSKRGGAPCGSYADRAPYRCGCATDSWERSFLSIPSKLSYRGKRVVVPKPPTFACPCR
jgi:hypothetical protein